MTESLTRTDGLISGFLTWNPQPPTKRKKPHAHKRIMHSFRIIVGRKKMETRIPEELRSWMHSRRSSQTTFLHRRAWLCLFIPRLFVASRCFRSPNVGHHRIRSREICWTKKMRRVLQHDISLLVSGPVKSQWWLPRLSDNRCRETCATSVERFSASESWSRIDSFATDC